MMSDSSSQSHQSSNKKDRVEMNEKALEAAQDAALEVSADQEEPPERIEVGHELINGSVPTEAEAAATAAAAFVDGDDETMPSLVGVSHYFYPVPCGESVSEKTTMSCLTECLSRVSLRSSARSRCSAISMLSDERTLMSSATTPAGAEAQHNYEGTFANLMDSPVEAKDLLRGSCRSDSSSKCMGRGPLHRALAEGASVEAVKELLTKDKEMCADGIPATRLRDTSGMTPLHLALKRNSAVAEALLLVLKEDPEVARWKDCSGRTPLHWGMKSGVTPDIIKALLHYSPGATLTADLKGRLPLHCIEKCTPLRSVDYVYNQCRAAARMKDFEQTTPLHRLCNNIVENGGIQSHDYTRLLVEMTSDRNKEFRADPKQEDRAGESPLGILIKDCFSKTNAFSSQIEMDMELLTFWGKQCAPLGKEHITDLTKLREKLRDLSDIVERLVEDTYAKQSEDCPRPESVRQFKRNRSSDTSDVAPTQKQKRLDNVDSNVSFNTGCTSFWSYSKGTNGSTAPTTAPSESIRATSTVESDCGSHSLQLSTNGSIKHASSGVQYLQEEGMPTLPDLGWIGQNAQPTNCEPKTKGTMELDKAIATTGGILHDDTHLLKIDANVSRTLESSGDISQPSRFLRGSLTGSIGSFSGSFASFSFGSLAGSFGSETVKAGTTNPPPKETRPVSASAKSTASEAKDPKATSPRSTAANSGKSMNQAEISVRTYQRRISGEAHVGKKVELILEMYQTEAHNIGMVKMDGPKRYMKRVYKVARCIHACYKGDKVAFCGKQQRLDVSRYKCPYKNTHWKQRGVDEVLVNNNDLGDDPTVSTQELVDSSSN